MAKSVVEIRELNQRITIQREVRTSDGQGGFSVAWEDVPPVVWAKIKPKKAREGYTTDQLKEISDHEITIRYRGDVTAEMRILWGNRTFQIKGKLRPDARRFYLFIDAQEGVAA